MLKHCLKCGHANPDATGAELEACPECGAIYSRVEAAMAARVAARRTTTPEQPGEMAQAMPMPAAGFATCQGGRTCLKCGHINAAANGGYLEECPGCGAIYTKVERAHAERQTAQAKAQEQASASAAAKATANTKRTPITAKYDAAEQSVTQRTGMGMGAWMLVILVMSILVSLTSQDRKPGSGSNTAQTPTAVVSNSGWDGSVHQVERYLKQNLKDPSSFEAIEWSPVVKGADDSFMVRVKYRAKNGFGGYAIEQKVFRLDANGAVTGVSDL